MFFGDEIVKEALLYEKLSDNKVRCLVCNHYCIIPEAKRGICGVRENIKGTLFALNYGKTIAIQIDPVEKKPLFHFLPRTKTYSIATVGCNFSCPWCQNYQISQSPKKNKGILGDYLESKIHIEGAKKYNCDSISYTYTEPTIFLEYALEIMKLAKQNNLKNIWVSNGYMSKETLNLIIPYVDALNIDLKGFNDELHKKYCGGSIKPIIDNIIEFYKRGIHIEITTLIVPGYNDNIEELSKISDFLANLDINIPWHITRFYPAWKMIDIEPTDINLMKKVKKIAIDKGLLNVHLGNI